MVLSMVITLGIVSYNFNQARNISFQKTVSYQKYTTNRNISHSSINLALRALDRKDSTHFSDSTALSMSFMGGSAKVYLSYPNASTHDTMELRSFSSYGGGSYESKLRLFRKPDPFPTPNGALGIRATPVVFNSSGHPAIDGRNYDITGTKLVGSGDMPAVAVMKKTDSVNVYNAGATLTGVPTAIKVDSTTVDPLPDLAIYKNAADITFNTPGTYTSQTWGSAAYPWIVYCNAGDDTTFSIKFAGGVVGYGILVVRGNVEFAGNFAFTGIVIIDGFNSQIQYSAASGTPEIIGAVLVAGNAGAAVTLKGTGSTPKIAYSSAAVNNAKYINQITYYSVARWYETDKTIDSLSGGFFGLQRIIFR